MTDIALIQQADGSFDAAMAGADLQADNTPRTAIALSLSSDRRANADDPLPDVNDTDLRGWWADAFPTVAGDAWGSRNWLFAREKQTQAALTLLQQSAEEGLHWLIEDGIAADLTVTASYPSIGMVQLDVELGRPTDPAKQVYSYLWIAEEQVQ